MYSLFVLFTLKPSKSSIQNFKAKIKIVPKIYVLFFKFGYDFKLIQRNEKGNEGWEELNYLIKFKIFKNSKSKKYLLRLGYKHEQNSKKKKKN